MVICAISKSDFITPHSNATQKRKHLKRKLLQFDRMNDELWNNFALKTDELIIESGLHQLESPLTTLSAINSLNDSLEQILRTASNMIIPYKWSSDNYFDNKPKSLITTHQYLKKLNRIILALRQSNRDHNIWPSQQEWNSYTVLMNHIILFYDLDTIS